MPAERIATSQGLPVNFLEHILAELRIAGVVRSQRGTEGGYRLARDPEQITIADIIRAVEGAGNVANAQLPASINLLADDPEAWVTR